jgi:dTDP-4-dehydrorhamnose reductase
LVNECRAVILAMRAIREINPDAVLVQTEDLAKVYSTPSLVYQADFENERRWATFDLLTGRLDRTGLVWSYLNWAGIESDELEWFLDNPVDSVVLGCNYYIVGERVLDDRLEHYPEAMHGGNGRHAYVDVEAVRVNGMQLAGWSGLMREAWQRYGLPLAMTEVQIHCYREAQLSWFLDAWKSACELRDANIDVRAVTAWSLLGSYNWNSLVTQDTGHYESGVFEVSDGTVRPTALAKAIRSLARSEKVAYPVCNSKPWWRRPDRWLYPPIAECRGEALADSTYDLCEQKRPILIIGQGILGTGFARVCQDRGIQYVIVRRPEVDITDRHSVERAIADYRPWAVINAAGFTRVNGAESAVLECHRVNAVGAKIVARACAGQDIQLLSFSSDLVFGGGRNTPFAERDAVGPLSAYGRSKVAAERRVLSAYPDALVIRSGAFFAAQEPYNLLSAALARMANGLPTQVVDDWVVSPTYVPDIAHRAIDLLIDGESGIWHLANDGALGWADFVEQAALSIGHDCRLVRRCRRSVLYELAPRPSNSALVSERGRALPTLENALARFRDQWLAADPAGENARRQAG